VDLREHTYKRRIDTIVALIAELTGERRAPERTWSEARAHPAYFDYLAGNGALTCASAELPAIARRSVAKATGGAAILTRAFARQARRRIRKRFSPVPVESRA
jgi:hypothetical protein